jgi:hypothetical protein
MKSKKNIFFTIILFTAALFCFEANTHVHFNTPLYNVENTTESSTGEDKCGSNCESYDDCKINAFSDFSYLEVFKYIIPQSITPIPSYIISFWQPPKISLS